MHSKNPTKSISACGPPQLAPASCRQAANSPKPRRPWACAAAAAPSGKSTSSRIGQTWPCSVFTSRVFTAWSNQRQNEPTAKGVASLTGEPTSSCPKARARAVKAAGFAKESFRAHTGHALSASLLPASSASTYARRSSRAIPAAYTSSFPSSLPDSPPIFASMDQPSSTSGTRAACPESHRSRQTCTCKNAAGARRYCREAKTSCKPAPNSETGAAWGLRPLAELEPLPAEERRHPASRTAEYAKILPSSRSLSSPERRPVWSPVCCLISCSTLPSSEGCSTRSSERARLKPWRQHCREDWTPRTNRLMAYWRSSSRLPTSFCSPQPPASSCRSATAVLHLKSASASARS
mmetsp:Transcript_9020/g.23540  ORF Transcript_9020/g.23540 Transcript_9020/m.23540 type:complete len:351 (-) Transcript_9020:141-1193(-)